MKKYTLLLLVGITAATAMAHAETAGDTTIVYSKRKVVIKGDRKETTVVVYNSDENEDKPYYEARYGENGDKKATWHMDASFDFPFVDIIAKKKKKKQHHFDAHWSGLGFGFCNAIQTGRGGLNGPEGVKTDFGSSYEIFWNIATLHIPINRRSLGLVSGIGIDWRNYKMDGKYRFVKEGTETSIEEYPEGANIEYSRLKTFDITFPLLLEWQNPQIRGKFYMSAGAVFNIKTYSSIKTEYELDGKEYEDFSKSVHQTPVNVDLMGLIGYRGIGFYFKYTLFPILQTSYSPEMKGISTGIMWIF